jgi:MFS family permease
MTRLQQTIIAINSFSSGILMPVLNLVLLEKGSSLQTLPLLLAIYSITVLCLELPSGICADIYGRKAVFLLSCGFQFISFSLLIAANNMVWLVFAIIFFGLGRAFSSGSLDALLIDQALNLHGESCLAKVTTRLAVLDGGGLAVGAIIGGIISSAAGTYLSNIVLRLVLIATVFILCLVFIKEQSMHDVKQHTSLIEHIKQGKQVILETSEFRFIFIGVFFAGFFLCTIETYWQPAFMHISTGRDSTWVLGFITFIGFFAVIFGNTIAQKILDSLNIKWWNVYNICRIIFAGCILVFAFQKNAAGFIAWYACVYLMLGAGNVAENTLINKFTPNHMRASMLSLNSLIVQIGSLCASVFSSIMILRLQFTGVWIVAGGLLGGYAVVVAAVTNRSGKKNKENPVSIPPSGV